MLKIEFDKAGAEPAHFDRPSAHGTRRKVVRLHMPPGSAVAVVFNKNGFLLSCWITLQSAVGEDSTKVLSRFRISDQLLAMRKRNRIGIVCLGEALPPLQ